MRPDVVVDIGNTRIKWGRCDGGSVVESVSLRADDPAFWQPQIENWDLVSPRAWAISGVHPQRRDRLLDWLRQRGDQVCLIDDPKDLPLRVLLDRPDHVGIDRLLDAVAANSRNGVRRDKSAVIIDAGSAVTVDWLDADGAFCGGAILPGLRLMAQALHDHTALLPLVEVTERPPESPGRSTPDAMKVGIYWAVAGGINSLIDRFTQQGTKSARVFLTGGDASLLQAALPAETIVWPHMTLEGLRLAAEALP